MLQVNLLPDVKKEFLKSQRERNFMVTICLFVSAVAVVALIVLGGVMGGQVIQKNILKGDIEKYSKTIQDDKKTKQLDEYLTVQNQLSKITDLKAQQPVYSQLFNMLQELNPVDPNGVSLSQVTLSGSGVAGAANSIQLQGTTASFQSLNVYKTTLSSAQVSYSARAGADVTTENLFLTVNVTQSAISQNSTSPGVSFIIVVTYNPVIFQHSTSNLSVEVPNKTTSDSIQNTPVFSTSGGSDGTDTANPDQNNGGEGQQ
jgi:Tfp pilus assembly protein PilN